MLPIKSAASSDSRDALMTSQPIKKLLNKKPRDHPGLVTTRILSKDLSLTSLVITQQTADYVCKKCRDTQSSSD